MKLSPVSMGYINTNYNYNMFSVYGNPRSLNRVEAVSETSKKTRPLVVMQENTDSPEVEENSMLPKVPAVAQGGFADMLKIQHAIYGNNESSANYGSDTGYIKDAMNVMMMGVNNVIPKADA